LIAAYETDRLLNASAAAMKEAKRFDHEHLRRRGLTRRECEVLWWVAEGKRNAEIGIILEIATVTVEVHLTSVYRKLGVENRMAAVANMSAEG
jgi:DNA-binding CsgD family transcriptional regulator